MSKAVQFDSYGGIDVLQVLDVPRPVPAAGEVLVKVKAAGINLFIGLWNGPTEAQLAALTAAITGLACIALFQAWGVDAFSWFTSGALGGRIVGALGTIGTNSVQGTWALAGTTLTVTDNGTNSPQTAGDMGCPVSLSLAGRRRPAVRRVSSCRRRTRGG